MLRVFGSVRRRVFCTLLVVGLLVPAMPMAAMAIPGDAERTIAWNLSEDNDQRFTTLLAAAGIAGLDGALDDCEFGPVTLFAPTNAAFAALQAALGDDAWDALLADPDALADVLLYHLLDGMVFSGDLPAPGNSISVPTLLGQTILIEVLPGTNGAIVRINGVALVIETDYEACNGVIHVIDTVLVPESEDEEIVTAPEVEEAEEATPVAAPGLPTTGLGPDRGSSLPWQAFVIAGLVFGLAYTALRKSAISQE